MCPEGYAKKYSIPFQAEADADLFTALIVLRIEAGARFQVANRVISSYHGLASTVSWQAHARTGCASIAGTPRVENAIRDLNGLGVWPNQRPQAHRRSTPPGHGGTGDGPQPRLLVMRASVWASR